MIPWGGPRGEKSTVGAFTCSIQEPTSLPRGGNMIRIAVVEDHEIVRDAIANLLGDADDMEVVSIACTLREALPLMQRQRPQVVLADLALEDGSGMELVRALRRERRKGRVLILTGL